MVWIGKNGKISTFLIFGFEINQNTTILKNCWQQSQFCALIAQSVEQVTLNHWVLGSNPRERTIFLSFFLIEFYDALPKASADGSIMGLKQKTKFQADYWPYAKQFRSVPRTKPAEIEIRTEKVVAGPRFELGTCGLWFRRSNQLS